MIFASESTDGLVLIDADEASRAPHWLDVIMEPQPSGPCTRTLTREGDKVRVSWVAEPTTVPAEVSNQQLRLALIDFGIMPSAILAQLQAMPTGADKERALAAWEYANTFRRDHPLVSALAAQIGLTSEQVDGLFKLAATLG